MPASTRHILTIPPTTWSALVLLALAASLFSACTTALDRNRAGLETLHAQGRYAEAASALDDPKVKDSYAPNSKLLYWLDRGAVALALGDHATAIALLEKAEDYTESQRQATGGEQLSQWLLNDSVINYYAEPYEEVYINVLKMLAQLEAGRIENGAAVEARRAAGKADVLRDRYLRASSALQARGGRPLASALSAAPASASTGEANPSGEFLESTLGTYLSAVAFMKDGDASAQSVAGRRLLSSIQLQQNLQRGVSTAAFEGLGELPPDAANVLLVGLSGRAPHKVANRVGPIPIYEWPLYFELPELAGGSEDVGSVRAIVTPESAGGAPVAPFELAKVEDMRAVATENHKRQLPVIYARTIIRSQLKAAAMLAATEGVKQSQRRGSGRDLAQIGMILGGLAFVGLTEHADLRAWTFLPGRADVALAKLQPGRYTARLEYLSPGNIVLYTTPPHAFEVPANADPARTLTTIVEHYWR